MSATPVLLGATAGGYKKPICCRALSDEEVKLMDAYWRASNYLTVGQIYLRGHDPLLQKELTHADIKARLLGHWGTCPGINFCYVHMNHVIKKHDLEMAFVTGPGHGGPALVAQTYLEGSYTTFYPKVTQDKAGMGLMMKQFSWPRGVPSHVAPFCPGTFHEGGELGYSLLHSYGAVLDNPNLLVACMVGDGEAETGPCATSWHSAKFINPVKDGAVLPILHLNGGRIATATVLSRMPAWQLKSMFEGYGYRVHVVEGNPDDSFEMHQRMAATLQSCLEEITKIQLAARSGNMNGDGFGDGTPAWPMIVLRTPKGWTGPKELDGKIIEGTFKAHQVPMPDAAKNPTQLKLLDQWMRSYRPQELFDAAGRLKPELAALAPKPDLCMGRSKHAAGGSLVKDLDLPPTAPYEFKVTKPGVQAECTPVLAKWLKAVFERNPTNFRMFCPDEMTSNKLSAVLEAAGRNAGFVNPNEKLDSPFDRSDGRVLEILSEHCCQGWLEGYVLTGRHGMFPCYEAFTTIVDSMLNQHAKWIAGSLEHAPWRKPVASLNYILTSHTWRQDHNGYSHQVTGFIDNATTKPQVCNSFFPPDANTLLVVAKQCLETRNKINLILCGKHDMPQWLSLEAAEKHVAAKADIWPWAGTAKGNDVDVVIACAGDVPTLEAMAAVQLLRERAPCIRTRFVNVVDLMSLSMPGYHEHALSEERFEQLFGSIETPVVFFFHGTPSTLHGLICRRRSAAQRFGIHGYVEKGSTTTPFDLTVMNEASRVHLVIDVLERVTAAKGVALEQSEHAPLAKELKQKLDEHLDYVWENGEDLPEIRDWAWNGPSP